MWVLSVLVQPIDFKAAFLWLRPFRRDILGLVCELELMKEVSLVDVPLLFFMVQGSTNHQDHLPSSFIHITRAILSLKQPVYGIALGETLGETRCRCFFRAARYSGNGLTDWRISPLCGPESTPKVPEDQKWPGLPIFWLNFFWSAQLQQLLFWDKTQTKCRGLNGPQKAGR